MSLEQGIQTVLIRQEWLLHDDRIEAVLVAPAGLDVSTVDDICALHDYRHAC
jgi:hypothetical protein